MNPIRKFTVGIISFIALLGASEYIMRILTDKEHSFAYNFRPGPYVYNKSLGLVTFKPNYKGCMNVPKSNIRIPLTLSKHGTRHINSNTDLDSCKKIVFLGGVSQTFGYGLRDNETIAGALVASSEYPLRIYNLALPGTNALQSLYRFKDYILTEIKPDVVIVFLYTFRDLRTYSQKDSIMKTFKPSILNPLEKGYELNKGWLEKKPKSLFEHSIVKSSLAKGLFNTYSELSGRLLSTLSKGKQLLNGGNKPLETATIADSNDSEQCALGTQRYIKFIQNYFSGTGTKVVFVFLPTLSGEMNYYRNITNYMPKDVIYLDVHNQVAGTPLESEKLPDGHYNPVMAHYIGRSVYKRIKLLF